MSATLAQSEFYHRNRVAMEARTHPSVTRQYINDKISLFRRPILLTHNLVLLGCVSGRNFALSSRAVLEARLEV